MNVPGLPAVNAPPRNAGKSFQGGTSTTGQMSNPGENPIHPAVEGPETPLEDVRHEAHQDGDAMRAIEAKLLVLEAREKEVLERLARLQADFDNFRRRTREDATQASGRGKETFLKALLPVLDNLERALAHAKDEGLVLLQRQLLETLRAQGITVLFPEGEAFDAKHHEAIAQENRDGVKPGTVLHVAEKGYALEGRVLRPARVIVAA
jgi:molecular chaperone GrpE